MYISYHNDMYFLSLIWPAGSAPAALARLLFDPPKFQIIGKIQHFVIFLSFRVSVFSFFWLFFFSDLLSFNLFLLSAFALLCFSSVHIVGNLTSKFSSINITDTTSTTGTVGSINITSTISTTNILNIINIQIL